MPAFRVLLRGETLRITVDGSVTQCGFYKNEFLWAKSPEHAASRARSNVCVTLRQNCAVTAADVDALSLKIEEIEVVGLLGFLRRQGFIFYPVDGIERDEA